MILVLEVKRSETFSRHKNSQKSLQKPENTAIALVVARFIIQTVGSESKENLEDYLFLYAKHQSAHLKDMF